MFIYYLLCTTNYVSITHELWNSKLIWVQNLILLNETYITMT